MTTAVFNGSAVVSAANARFFNGQQWVYNEASPADGSDVYDILYNDDGSIFQTGPGIDCSDFVQQAMLAAGYNVRYASTPVLGAIIAGTSSDNDYITVATPAMGFVNVAVGDVIVFKGHCGIVTAYNPLTGVGTYEGAQSTDNGLLPKVYFTTDPRLSSDPSTGAHIYWGSAIPSTNAPLSPPLLGFLEPNLQGSGYLNMGVNNSTEALAYIGSINLRVNEGLQRAGLAPYFTVAQTNASVTPPSTNYDPGLDPTTGMPGYLPYSITTLGAYNNTPWQSVTNYYDANSQPTQTRFDLTNGDQLTFASTTFSSPQYTASSPLVSVPLIVDDPVPLGTLSINANTGVDFLTLSNGLVVNLPGAKANSVSAVALTTTPEQTLLDYLSDLSDPLTAAQLDTDNYNYLNPAALANMYRIDEGPIAGGDEEILYDYAGGSGSASPNIAGATTADSRTAFNLVEIQGIDFAHATLTNIQKLEFFDPGITTLTQAQFSQFAPIIAGASPSDVIRGATGGTYNLTADPNADISLTASDWSGTTLIGNNQNGEILTASLFGNDTLQAGNGTGDQLVAGDGVDTLIGGTGGDTFVVNQSLTDGSVIRANGTGNVLKVATGSDISGATITGVQTLSYSGNITLSSAQKAEFTNITGTGTINVVPSTPVTVAAGQTLNVTGTQYIGDLVDDGTVAIAGGADLDVWSAVDPSSSGIFQLMTTGSLEINSILGTSTTIQFLGTPVAGSRASAVSGFPVSTHANKLIIDNTADFGTNVGAASYLGPLLEEFSVGDSIDLKGISSSGLKLAYSTSTGDLQITGSSGSALATLQFQKSTLGAGAPPKEAGPIGGSLFASASDGAGGTLITFVG